MKKRYLAALFTVFASIATACSTPVFRYAIERWEADPYPLYVFTDSDLTAEQKQIVSEASRYERYGFRSAPLDVQVWNIGSLSNDAKRIWEKLPEAKELPCVALGYPSIMRIRRPAWVDDLSGEAVRRIAMSPVRLETAQRLLGGDAAVWLFLRGEDQQENQQIRAMLNAQLREMEETIEYNADFLELARQAGTEVPELKFSVLELDQNDPAEQVLLAMLTGVSDEVKNHSGPILVPVFGQGRAAVIMMDEYIAPEYIRTAVDFLTGACACEIKALNPGFDLLIPVDWIGGITEEYVFDSELPPLTSPSAAFEPPPDETPFADADERMDHLEDSQTGLFAVVLGVFIITAVGALAFATWLLMRKHHESV